jgi:hypothetical protein
MANFRSEAAATKTSCGGPAGALLGKKERDKRLKQIKRVGLISFIYMIYIILHVNLSLLPKNIEVPVNLSFPELFFTHLLKRENAAQQIPGYCV